MSDLITDNLPLIATAPDGIKRLRGLILELAVRGKLVPQDPTDEPASELLKRIEAEKARLVKEGKIRKAKQTDAEDSTSSDVIAEDVPDGWALTTLGNTVEIVRGITFPASEKSKLAEEGRVACIRTANVQDSIEWDDLLYIRRDFVSRTDQFLAPDDIVISMANSRELVGKVALVSSLPESEITFGGFLGVIRPHQILPGFIMCLLRAPTVRDSLIDSASQTTNIANISLGKLRPLRFALPHLAEQHRIIARVDELMALCDRLEAEQADAAEAHARLVDALLATLTASRDAAECAANWQRLSAHFDTLFTTEASITALNQTVLQLAVMGRLVPQDPSDEPASELLKRTEAEKARLVKEGRIRKPKVVEAVGEEERPFEMPRGWEWVKLTDLVSVIDSGWSPACADHAASEAAWGVLRTTAVQQMRYLEHENKALPPNLKPRPECEVKSGDILITRAGPKNRVGVSCLVESTRDRLMISDKIIRFHLVPGIACDKFIVLCLNAGPTAEYLETAKSGMAESQMNISQTKLAGAPLLLPPLPEQHRIVAKVDELMALCDRLKADLATARDHRARLADTLVEAALEAA